ncbi:MAG: serine/threonine protein kinase [Sandaracinaceae bacterium]|nr:serine/threonine protein kinase [Sandaracinaceae bacterium]
MSKQDRLIGGKYRIVRKLAEGGMGEVFEAEHNLTHKKAALKILFPHVAKDEAARQRFLREVRAPAQIDHDGIVEVFDAGFDLEDGSLFVVMEFLDGEPLRDRLAKGGVSLDLLLDWFERILDPLAMAHEKGIVHRDLKPENVFMSKEARRRRGHQDPRLRHRARSRPVAEQRHPHRHRHGHAALHGARAGHEREGRLRAGRRVGARRDALRGADRPASLRR